MTRTRRAECKSGNYHLIARGVSHSIIFEDDTDRRFFVSLLKKLTREFCVTVYAWCLMDNHYHMLVHAENAQLSEFMRKLNSVYAMYFNNRYDRSGHLFQERYKSEPVETDEYFLTVLRYIHQNPCKAGIAGVADYMWSSYREYISEDGISDTSFALELLDGVEGFVSFHEIMDMGCTCMTESCGRQRVPDDEALAVARTALLETPIEHVAGLSRAERDRCLRKLKDAHLTIRQIERLTGVSRSVVSRA